MGIMIAGRMDNTIDNTLESANRVYDTRGIAPTQNTCGGGGRETMILEETEPVLLGGLSDRLCNNDTQFHFQDRVYDGREHLACSVTASINPKYLTEEKACGAIRGRGDDNEQKLELRGDGVTNTITTIEKDNVVVEKVRVKQNTKDGFIECNVGGLVNLSEPSSKTRRGRVIDDGETSPTLQAGSNDICKVESRLRIRRITPRESWRLMGFSDEDFDKAAGVCSSSQLYKQAGNSIVVDVLEAIFKELIA